MMRAGARQILDSRGGQRRKRLRARPHGCGLTRVPHQQVHAVSARSYDTDASARVEARRGGKPLKLFVTKCFHDLLAE